MAKKRVLVLLRDYPQLSQTYKENELKYLWADFEVRVGSFVPAETPYRQHFPFDALRTRTDIVQLVRDFRPDVIHGHYLHTLDVLAFASEAGGGVPFTVRTHSFDVIARAPEHLAKWAPYAARSTCLGVLAFPFLRPVLERAGIPPGRIVDDWPVVDFGRFHDAGPNGEAIVNTGACIPKKNMESYIDLATMVPERRFLFCPIGYQRDKLVEYNTRNGDAVRILETVEPDAMPPIYKSAQWLVYTANPRLPTIGWPMAVAEAQASGCGVLVQRVRPDLVEYVGPGGHCFDSLEEAAEILRQPYPEAMRARGFEHARRSDIRVNIRKLHALWGFGSPGHA